MQVGAESRQNVPPCVELRHRSDYGRQPPARGSGRRAQKSACENAFKAILMQNRKSIIQSTLTLKSHREYCQCSIKQIPTGRRIMTCSTALSAMDTPWSRTKVTHLLLNNSQRQLLIKFNLCNTHHVTMKTERKTKKDTSKAYMT